MNEEMEPLFFLHSSDHHIGKIFRGLPPEKGRLLRESLKNVLEQCVNLIEKEGIPFWFIAGDFVEVEYLDSSTLRWMNEKLARLKRTRIFISPGETDCVSSFVYSSSLLPENVHIFLHPDFEEIHWKGVNIYGRGCADPAEPFPFGFQVKDPEAINILLFHGSDATSVEEESLCFPFTPEQLLKTGSSYIALGHLHTGRNVLHPPRMAVYPGSPVMLSFLERGEHGVILGKIENHQISTQRLNLGGRNWHRHTLKITPLEPASRVFFRLTENLQEARQEDILHLTLEGERNPDEPLPVEEWQSSLKSKFFEVLIREDTAPGYHLEALRKEHSLRGQLVRQYIETLRDVSSPDEEALLREGLLCALQNLERKAIPSHEIP